MNNRRHLLGELQACLTAMGPVALAVSGGVDSMTLAAVAGRTSSVKCEIFHAVSPAVPPEATAWLRQLAAQEGWQLSVISAGEFDDSRYSDNPTDRCYFCKTNLYRSIATRTNRVILSGANLDDLRDYRPGLNAARENRVRRP